jgi:hypothetical protein
LIYTPERLPLLSTSRSAREKKGGREGTVGAGQGPQGRMGRDQSETTEHVSSFE